MTKRRKLRRKNKLKRKSGCLLIICFMVLAVLVLIRQRGDLPEENVSVPVSLSLSTPEERLETFAGEHNLQLSDWPEEMLELLQKNPDAEEFVLNYPLKKDAIYEIDLSEYKDTAAVPQLFQWDERWGYSAYGSTVMGLSGCGPTCLSMVSIYLLNNTAYHPRYIADFSEKNGYCVPGNGSAWALISEGGRKLGMEVTEIPLVKDRVIKNLQAGNPIICIMGPGEFTDNGHFIVLTAYKGGKIKLNDPNSRTRSEKLWDFEELEGQIENLWVFRKRN